MPKKWLTSEMFNPTFTLTDSAVSSAEGVLGVDAGGGGGGASPLPSPLEKKKYILYVSMYVCRNMVSCRKSPMIVAKQL